MAGLLLVLLLLLLRSPMMGPCGRPRRRARRVERAPVQHRACFFRECFSRRGLPLLMLVRGCCATGQVIDGAGGRGDVWQGCR